MVDDHVEDLRPKNVREDEAIGSLKSLRGVRRHVLYIFLYNDLFDLNRYPKVYICKFSGRVSYEITTPDFMREIV